MTSPSRSSSQPGTEPQVTDMQLRPPLRVLHFVSGGFSGATQVAIDLCGAQPGQQTLLALHRRPSVDPTERIRELRTQGLAVELVPRWSHAATILALKAICNRWRPDVLVAHGYSEHLWGRYAGLLAGVPRLIQVEHNTRERYNLWRLQQSLWLARRTERIICVSQAVKDALVRRGHPTERCTVVLNGIELERWTHGHPWNEREDAIVMPARFASQKDHFTLIRAIALLAARGLQPTVYLAGEGKSSWRHRAEQLARKLGVQEQVRFLGHVAALPELMGRVKFCVLSTHYEGLGLGLIEGMASGCCGIGSDVEGVREILKHGETGFLVPHEDPAALAETLADLLADTTTAARIAEAGQRHAQNAFDRRRMRQQYLSLFLQTPHPDSLQPDTPSGPVRGKSRL
ncbi:MAG TPA: glycosyltransferase family 4 protein [Ottowia sp.]|uniref:glycosyltransferase family 4 protein n=1 Tax=Ottowia sp. TaxID=1898956 RepID=UPI002D18BB5D|nr:glycosyltransferase family 4 protein [Ottowia sp.]HMN21009.1 glycosyltransferase family 4 protein [Ottowia sp.]